MKMPRLPAASWTLFDQATLSLGTFLFNIVLARHLSISAYGGYAMFIGIISVMQVICGALIFYPLSVRGSVLAQEPFRQLVVTALILTVIVGMPVALLLAALVDLLIGSGLFLAAFCALAAGQMQEGFRRGLLASFRHRDAVIGDAASYLGQVVLVLALSGNLDLDLGSALYVMALTSLVGAGIQCLQLMPLAIAPLPLGPTFRDFWSLGVWSLSSNVLNIVRGQSLPWVLTYTFGPAAAGMFQATANIANVTNPIQTGVANVIPQAAARAYAGGHRAAFRASWPYMIAGLPLVASFVIIMLILPNELLALAYDSNIDSEAVVTPLRLMAVTAIFCYVAAAGCAHLHGVNGGRAGLLAGLASTLCVAVMIYPAVLYFGIVGACAAALFGFVVRATFIVLTILDGVMPSATRANLPFVFRLGRLEPDSSIQKTQFVPSIGEGS